MDVIGSRQRRDLVHHLGRRIATIQGDPIPDPLRPSVSERLAGIHAKESRAQLSTLVARQTRRALLFPAAACFIGLLLWLFWPSHASLTYAIADQPGALNQWVAAGDQPLGLDFSEGSRVELAPGARARVSGLEPRGATVLVETGAVHVRVVPRSDNAWAIVAGPFRVNVVGTEFDLRWDAPTQVLEVAMVEGHVTIDGACIEGGVALSAPNQKRLSCSKVDVVSSASPADPSAEPYGPVAPAETATSSATASPVASWRVRLRSGPPGDVLGAVEANGVEQVLAEASGPELMELGSAARRGGRPELARRFYLTVRQRFAQSDAASTAAYHLGRMAFDGSGAWAEADRWFAVYLAERPGGTLAAEALGRSIECAQKRGDLPRARQLAERYLAQYPNGAHAGLAGTVLASPN